MALRRKLKRDERLEHERLTSLINSMADAVIAVDEQVQVVLYNAAALNILDINTLKTGTDLTSIFKPLDKDNQPKPVKAMVQAVSVPTTSRDLKLQYNDGSQINLYLSIAPVHLGYGKHGTHGYVLLLRDITREKSLEEERDEFISVVSHELRTPITIAEGNISNAQLIIKKGGDNQAISKALAEAHNQVLFLAEMINDLSTLSRAERGKLQVMLEDVQVNEIVEELAHTYGPDADKKNLKFEVIIKGKLPELRSNRLYVREILQNFITNAIKYTAEGGITVTAEAVDKGIKFSVSDTGIGISKGDQDRVYDKFFRSEDYRTRQANGTGLGLYVTIKLARLIHAEINLQSELDKGSTFTITVPNLD